MWTRRSKRAAKTDNIELQEGRSLMRAGSQEGEDPAKVPLYTRAHRGLYLGRVPVSEASGKGCTENAVSLLLDKASLDCADIDYIYMDVKPCGLVFYHVDFACKVTHTQSFNISRISYCSGEHLVDPCIFAWIFHQENQSGFQLECHAVRVKSERRAKFLAFQLQQAFHALYKDVQAALESSKLFHAALSQKQNGETQEEALEDGDITGRSEGICELDIPGKEVMSLPKPDLVSHPLSPECF